MGIKKGSTSGESAKSSAEVSMVIKSIGIGEKISKYSQHEQDVGETERRSERQSSSQSGLALCQWSAVHEEVHHFLPEKEPGQKWLLGLRHRLRGIGLFPEMGIPGRPRINGTVGVKKQKKKKNNPSIFKKACLGAAACECEEQSI